ncbi:14587_t:CDS:2 [Ambispora leptoticha]|uniref:14587_t:CDS:1 n=1 Tax=Ambispora leptoticha TaxID=144679 RepID=A0A9N9FE12_9GLOM|nr:14587_t:CDS:2 [Ambispora leptoticha]
MSKFFKLGELRSKIVQPLLNQIDRYTLSRHERSHSIVENVNTGPMFGDSDLVLAGPDFLEPETNYGYKSSYEYALLLDDEYFNMDEYEVFQVISK